MRIKKYLAGSLLISGMAVSAVANAALVGRLPATSGGTDYQAYYDTDADLTWLADANYNQTVNSGYGDMSWSEANAWAASLEIDSITGWRLPYSPLSDTNCSNAGGLGTNCTNGEIDNLFYNVLGGVANASIIDIHNSDYDLFSNIQNYRYWSATEYRPSVPNTNDAIYFQMNNGTRWYGSQYASYYAWAVHDGDIGAPVPIPAAAWLFGSGLLGLIGVGKHKKNT